MNRIGAVFIGAAIGGAVGIGTVTYLISMSSPNYYRDSGSPPLLPGIFLGGPGGLLAGTIFGALVPLKRR